VRLASSCLLRGAANVVNASRIGPRRKDNFMMAKEEVGCLKRKIVF
jgi:hypothetical protein